MAVSGSSNALATVGPPQDLAIVLVDLAAPGPNGETSGKALGVVQVGTGGVIVAGATAANQATQITAEQAILAKLSADPATQTTLAAVLAKLTSDPATQTTLAAILAKIIASPATEATLAAQSAKLPASLGAKASSGSLSVANSFLTCAAGGDGSVGNSAETITVANTVQLVEFFNLSANPIWASWVGTAVASTTGSFPIPPLASNTAGFYSAPPGASGSLSIIAPAGASAFTCNLWS